MTKYDKLVRDRIPEIIDTDGTVAEVVTLREAEFVVALRSKLVEEAREVAAASSREALLTELADVLEVVLALAGTVNVGLEDLDEVRRLRIADRGAFARRLLLMRTHDRVPGGDSDTFGGLDGAPGRGSAANNVVIALYEMVRHLARHDWNTPANDLPANGIYLFFERGEVVEIGGEMRDRIVRVGTHNENGRFRSRIQQHYGPRKSPGGSRRGSVFRQHVGGALLRRADPGDARLENWLRRVGKFPEVEAEVSQVLRDYFTFVCFPVEDKDERLRLESGLIGLLAQYPLGSPSASWLGRHAEDDAIHRSGLWNVQRVNAKPLTMDLLERIKVLAGLA